MKISAKPRRSARVKGNSLTWDVKIFERLPDELCQLNEYSLPERIWPVAKMKSALSKHFDILETNLREEGRNMLFVCRKKQFVSPWFCRRIIAEESHMKHKRALTPQSRRIDSQHQQNRAMRSANDGKIERLIKQQHIFAWSLLHER